MCFKFYLIVICEFLITVHTQTDLMHSSKKQNNRTKDKKPTNSKFFFSPADTFLQNGFIRGLMYCSVLSRDVKLYLLQMQIIVLKLGRKNVMEGREGKNRDLLSLW